MNTTPKEHARDGPDAQTFGSASGYKTTISRQRKQNSTTRKPNLVIIIGEAKALVEQNLNLNPASGRVLLAKQRFF